MNGFWIMVVGILTICVAVVIVGIVFQMVRNRWGQLDKHVEKHSKRYKTVGVAFLLISLLWYGYNEGWYTKDCTSYDTRSCLDD